MVRPRDARAGGTDEAGSHGPAGTRGRATDKAGVPWRPAGTRGRATDDAVSHSGWEARAARLTMPASHGPG
jgi:hypothetical protein